jgi:hypothetical protein
VPAQPGQHEKRREHLQQAGDDQQAGRGAGDSAYEALRERRVGRAAVGLIFWLVMVTLPM